MTTIAEQAATLRLPPTKLLINGEWSDAASGKTFAVRNPATAEVIAEVAEAGAEDADRAVRAARAAFDGGPWSTMTAAERGRRIGALVALMRAHQEELVLLEAVDAGKPVSSTRRQDLPAALECFEYFAGWPDKITGTVVPVRPDALTYVAREPVGVVAAIIPWNFPLMHAAWKIAPALACGCTVVLKPASDTPMSALRLGELALEAGIPAGVLNIIPGPGAAVGMALAQHPLVDKISFTGSPPVGKQIMAAAAPNCTRVTLELGGKSPNLIFEDADLETAVRGSAAGIFFNSGQVCSAGSRILVAQPVHDEFVARFIARSQALKVGDPLDERTYMGPIISPKQLTTIMGYIETGQGEGAQLSTGGRRLDRPGYFIEPTVFTHVDNAMRIAQEEIFGPVASVIPFSDEDEAIRLANGTSYSLAAGLWTRDVARAHSVARRLRAGTVWVNTYGQSDPRLPWGGAGRDSGIGRDLGEAAIEYYTEKKSVWVSLRR